MKIYIIIKKLVLLVFLLSFLSCNRSLKQDRFVFIDYNVVIQDLKEKGKASEYYKKLNYEAMICLDTNSIATFKKINPDFMQGNYIDSSFMEKVRFVNKSWGREMHVDYESLSYIFTNEDIINRMCSYINKNGVSYNNIDSTVYIKDDNIAYFTHKYIDGFETFRLTLKEKQLKVQLVSEINSK